MNGSLTAQFERNPLSFLRKHFVYVSEALQPVEERNGVRRFLLKNYAHPHPANKDFAEVELDLAASEKDTIEAYWLPYVRSQAPVRELGDAGNYMFTVNLNGCTFGCELSGSDRVASGCSPRVVHVASEISDALQWQATSYGPTNEMMRIEEFRRTHGYDDSVEVQLLSTVLGLRKNDGRWTFYVQAKVLVIVQTDAEYESCQYLLEPSVL